MNFVNVLSTGKTFMEVADITSKLQKANFADGFVSKMALVGITAGTGALTYGIEKDDSNAKLMGGILAAAGIVGYLCSEENEEKSGGRKIVELGAAIGIGIAAGEYAYSSNKERKELDSGSPKKKVKYSG